MKVLLLFLLPFLMIKGCSEKGNNVTTDIKVVYTASTRGFFQKITIQNHQVSVSKDRKEEGIGTSAKISEADWNELVQLYSKLDLEKIKTYEAPTQKRLFDGAPTANMSITEKDTTYETTTFDHKSPPVEMAAFVNKVVALAEKKVD